MSYVVAVDKLTGAAAPPDIWPVPIVSVAGAAVDFGAPNKLGALAEVVAVTLGAAEAVEGAAKFIVPGAEVAENRMDTFWYLCKTGTKRGAKYYFYFL